MEKVSKNLSNHLDRVSELVKRIAPYGDQVPQIDADLLLQALRDMYETAYAIAHKAAHYQEEGSKNPTPEPGNDTDSATEKHSPDETAKTVIAAAAVTPVAAEVAKQTTPDEDAELASLLMDADAEPQFAEDEDIAPADEQHIVEELQGKEYDDLFASSEEPAEEPVAETIPEAEQEPEPQPTPEPEPIQEPEPVQAEVSVAEPATKPTSNEPRTLWDKLQEQHTSSTLGEKQGNKSLFDQLTEKAQQGTLGSVKAATEPVEEKAIAPIETPSEPEPQATPEPKAAPEPPATPEPVATKDPEPAKQQSSLFDILNSGAKEQPTTRTIADNLGGVKQGGIDSKLNNHKVKDLRTIININDKFMFMNELFRNNMRGYNDFILQLNAIDDREEAQRHVDMIAQQYGWDNESLAVQTFYKVFDRKF